MRKAIWTWARRNEPQGKILPKWLRAVYATLYPLEYLRWHLTRWHGWNWESDTYRLYGVTFTCGAIRTLTSANGEVYRITKKDDVVTFERVDCKPIPEVRDQAKLEVEKRTGLDERMCCDVDQLIARLRAFQDWRRGGEGEQPDPAVIGADIDAAITLLSQLARMTE